MKKFSKRLMATAIVAGLAINSAISIPAIAATDAYATTNNWELHYSTYDQRLSKTMTLVSSGNGYTAYITGKGGNCSLNYVTISADYMTSKSISEKGKDYAIEFKPTKFTNDYVIFTVKLTYGEGTQASNSGTIETI